jgi:hypothetical protein
MQISRFKQNFLPDSPENYHHYAVVHLKNNNEKREELVFRAEDYQYSSAIDYSGGEGLLENVIIA